MTYLDSIHQLSRASTTGSLFLVALWVACLPSACGTTDGTTESDRALVGPPPTLTTEQVVDAVQKQSATTLLVSALQHRGCTVDVGKGSVMEWADSYLPFFAGTYRWQVLSAKGACASENQRAGFVALTNDDGTQTEVLAFHSEVDNGVAKTHLLNARTGEVVETLVDDAFHQQAHSDLIAAYGRNFRTAGEAGVVGLHDLLAAAKGLTPVSDGKSPHPQSTVGRTVQAFGGTAGVERDPETARSCGAAFLGELFSGEQTCCDCQSALNTCIAEIATYGDDAVALDAIGKPIAEYLINHPPSHAGVAGHVAAQRHGSSQAIGKYTGGQISGRPAAQSFDWALYIESLTKNLNPKVMSDSLKVLEEFRNYVLVQARGAETPFWVNLTSSEPARQLDMVRAQIMVGVRQGVQNGYVTESQFESIVKSMDRVLGSRIGLPNAETSRAFLQALTDKVKNAGTAAYEACQIGPGVGCELLTTTASLLASLKAWLVSVALPVTGVALAATVITVVAVVLGEAATIGLQRQQWGIGPTGASAADESHCARTYVNACDAPSCSMNFFRPITQYSVTTGGHCSWDCEDPVFCTDEDTGEKVECGCNSWEVHTGNACYLPYDVNVATQIPCQMNTECHYDAAWKRVLPEEPQLL